MSDIYIEVNCAVLNGRTFPLCVRKDNIEAVYPDNNGNARLSLVGRRFSFDTTIPYEEFIKQFMVIKMEEKK